MVIDIQFIIQTNLCQWSKRCTCYKFQEISFHYGVYQRLCQRLL